MAISTRHLHRRNLREGGEGPTSPTGTETEAEARSPTSPNHQSPVQESTAVLDGLSNGGSKLASFLFVGDEGDNNDLKRMGEWDAQWYALALEPTAIRNERIIMLFEAYAIFGALFMSAGELVGV